MHDTQHYHLNRKVDIKNEHDILYLYANSSRSDVSFKQLTMHMAPLNSDAVTYTHRYQSGHYILIKGEQLELY